MTKPDIHATERLPTKRLPTDTMRVINQYLDLREDSDEVKMLLVYAIKNNELTKFLLVPEGRKERSENDREEQVEAVDCETVLKVRTKSGNTFLCLPNPPGSGYDPRCQCSG